MQNFYLFFYYKERLKKVTPSRYEHANFKGPQASKEDIKVVESPLPLWNCGFPEVIISNPGPGDAEQWSVADDAFLNNLPTSLFHERRESTKRDYFKSHNVLLVDIFCIKIPAITIKKKSKSVLKVTIYFW